MKKYKIIVVLVSAIMFVFTACVNDLDTLPLDQDVLTSASVYNDPDKYINVLAKLYAGLSVSGQIGPHGNNDLSGLDEGFGQYLRAYWYAQEVTTDEAILGWNDGNLRDYFEMDWGSNNEFISNMYYRIFYQISLCNEFLRETTEAKMNERGIQADRQTEIMGFRAEARFLRAMSYYHALDMFANVPFVTEEDAVGSFFPEQIARADLFNYVESELLEVEGLLPAPRTNEYGRADQAAAWMLLSKLYLNAEVYIEQEKYSEVITYTKKVIDAGYTLENNYEYLFLADNNLSNEIIFPITFDGLRTQTWGGTTFIINAEVGGSMVAADYGISGPWSGLRTMKSFVGKFYNLETLKSAKMPMKSAIIAPRKSVADYPVLYVAGNYQAASGYGADWSPGDENIAKLASVNNDGVYEGYIYFANDNVEFKLLKSPDWIENDTNGDPDAGGMSGTLQIGAWGGNNIKVAEKGFYRIIADFNAATYSVTKTDWGLIGSGTPGGWDSDTNLLFNPDTKAWTGVMDLTANEVKFRANDGWDINLGDNGGDGTLEYNGANIAIQESGEYLVNLYLGTPDYTYTIEKNSTMDMWGLIGSATPSGWDSDINMVYNEDNGTWSLLIDLKVGEVKFRANDSWFYNLGDNEGDGTLERDGGNIVITTPGKYLFILDPENLTYVMEGYIDHRAMFYTDGQNLDIEDPFLFTDGWAITKFKNVTRDGVRGSHQTHCDTDFPMFRLADAYLMYAEAVLRGGSGGDMGTALQYVNLVRERAYGNSNGNITQGDLNLDFILDERARELYWECSRRTDLIRFGKFSGGDYIWQWKGAVQEGKAIDAKYDLFPIPASDVVANINLVQNPGY
ncbi:MAG: RagB/SusD family nutrient uptake outer membrane protein [Prolixibacteraceae bacterium]|nr:RagB/SusD family nutrient uptake outer membrane protein [Prolixibacteraceae bacterium]